MHDTNQQRQPIIAVCGAGTCDAATSQHAETVGRELASAGAVLVCGGLGGVMEAACRGAVQAGGTTLGILPGLDAAAANPWVQLAIPTNMGHARNLLIVQTAQVVIAISGEYGTLSEIALARKIGRTVIGLHTWALGTAADQSPHIVPASTPAEAVRLALQALTTR